MPVNHKESCELCSLTQQPAALCRTNTTTRQKWALWGRPAMLQVRRIRLQYWLIFGAISVHIRRINSNIVSSQNLIKLSFKVETVLNPVHAYRSNLTIMRAAMLTKKANREPQGTNVALSTQHTYAVPHLYTRCQCHPYISWTNPIFLWNHSGRRLFNVMGEVV